ncbi:response regulator [Sinorhizobium sp. RAC02]|uniref:response regulator transcription factor n=1 Tax=Sinorhizobium sp. RAC02 TaxID=1842534 RepID=UPI00083D9255|nr:response regulator [Sinorhizobium sp. RAC02]AOF92794.1 bacterial regulatory s, luxR family protein [Sinorhizobium sp. RAC02]
MLAHPVYIVDDDEGMLESIALLLDFKGYIYSKYNCPQRFLADVGELRAGCVLIDMDMPLITGLDVCNTMRARGILWPFIVLTGCATVGNCQDSFRSGAVDFLTKPADMDEISASLSAASRRLDKILEKQEAISCIGMLTERESEVLAYVCAGYTSKNIAYAMGISIRTVDAHRANIASKLKTTSVAEFVQLRLLAGG